jgi:hypothetical protein
MSCLFRKDLIENAGGLIYPHIYHLIVSLQSVPKTFWQTSLNKIVSNFFLFRLENCMQFSLDYFLHKTVISTVCCNLNINVVLTVKFQYINFQAYIYLKGSVTIQNICCYRYRSAMWYIQYEAYLCLFTYCGVQHILCCAFSCVCLHLVCRVATFS